MVNIIVKNKTLSINSLKQEISMSLPLTDLMILFIADIPFVVLVIHCDAPSSITTSGKLGLSNSYNCINNTDVTVQDGELRNCIRNQTFTQSFREIIIGYLTCTNVKSTSAEETDDKWPETTGESRHAKSKDALSIQTISEWLRSKGCPVFLVDNWVYMLTTVSMFIVYHLLFRS